jgi:hypothetical protein
MKIARPTTALAVLLLAMAAGAAGSQQLLERLRGDHAALVAAESDFRLQRERGTLGTVEANDYAAYVARLFRRVAEDCQELAGSGIPIPADIPCPESPAPVVRAVPIDQGAEQTGAERVAALDAELNAGLGTFDEMLLREQERVKATRPRSESGAAGGGQGDGSQASGAADGGAGAGGEDDASGAAIGSERAGDSVDGADPDGDADITGGTRGQADSGARGGRGTEHQTAAKGQPSDIPDGSDDDVVARQLREAAEKETDPELKKKLWEEYRKYKRGTR